MTTSISTFEIINFVTPDPKYFSCISASAAGVAVVNPNVVNPNSLSKCFIKGKPPFSDSPKSLS